MLKKRVLWAVCIIIIIVSAIIIGSYAFRDSLRKPLKSMVVDEAGIEHTVNTEYGLKNIRVVCRDTTEFSVAMVYLTVVGVGSECEFYWEVPSCAEVSVVDSNRGGIESNITEDGVIVGLEGGVDTQIVIYLKTYDLEGCLNSMLSLNQSAGVLYGFNYVVELPDYSTVSFDTYYGEEDIVLGKYIEGYSNQ